MKKLLKRGADINFFMILMIVAVALGVMWFIIFGRGTASFAGEMGKQELKQRIQSCKVGDFILDPDETSGYADRDGDGLPDYCDNCPDTPNFGDEVKDDDGDGFPVPKDPKLQKLPSKGGQLCCAKGVDDSEIEGNEEKYCETQENDLVYGPKKMISAYIKG